MSSGRLRIFVILALLSISGLLFIQVTWFKKAFDQREEEFVRNTRLALNEVVTGILRFNNTSSRPEEPVERIAANNYVVHVNDQIDPQVLEHYLVKSFRKFNINQKFEFSIYDCANQKMVTGKYVDELQDYTLVEATPAKTMMHGDNYYFTVYFPHMNAGVLGNMGFWLYSSLLVFVVTVFFGYSLFVILKQKRLSEIQRDFINNMTHEFRTPLTSIAVSAKSLQDPNTHQSTQRLITYATIISDEAVKLKNQVDRVLSVADSDARLQLKPELFDLNLLLKDVAGKVVMNAGPETIELVFSLTAEPAMILGDKLHIANLISNLVDNAIKYSREHPQITIRTRNDKNRIEVSVEDNGIGIPKEHQKKVFDKFFRVPTGNVHNVKGFGIGLHYVQLITRLHKGQVKLSSVPGAGSIFKFTLPLA